MRKDDTPAIPYFLKICYFFSVFDPRKTKIIYRQPVFLIDYFKVDFSYAKMV